jgi:release factor glutamine methyltransferase
MTTVNDWLAQAVTYLEAAEVTTARLDAIILLEDCLGRARAWLLAHPDSQLSSSQASLLKKLLKRRAAHEPLAYVRGRSEFYNHEFVLSPAVLQPRPESETFIELLKELAQSGSLQPSDEHVIRLADVGAGSGALGITAALEIPNCQVELLEIDRKAAEVAKINVDKFTLNISVTLSDLLTSSNRPYDILLCNLPYVPDDYQINQAAHHEPKIAIFGGPDGLEVYRRLFDQVQKRTFKPLFILTESFTFQHQNLREIAQYSGYRLIKTDDFIQVYKHEIYARAVNK